MVKYFDSQHNRYIPVGEISVRVPIWGETYGAAFSPNYFKDIDYNPMNNIDISFDDWDELKAFQHSVNSLLDNVENILYNKKEESVELFKERVK